MAIAQLLFSFFTVSLYDRIQRQFVIYIYCPLHILQNELGMRKAQNNHLIQFAFPKVLQRLEGEFLPLIISETTVC